MKNQNYIRKIKELPMCEVSMGYQTIVFFNEKEIEEGQIGYSRDEKGNDLTGNKEEDWKSNWIVIGYDELLGDPIFIDIKDNDFPVYTAMHGLGYWEPEILASKFSSFVASLEIIIEVSKNRENPVALSNNKLSFFERRNIIKKIKNINPSTQSGFWKSFLK